ncbi:MAG: hypothetical protein CMH27_06715 [Micavibrio sp.]|nr:hypothetical protein [Micavibrio sp.]
MNRILPVILCGGAGRRLAPLSTMDKPKQFHALSGGVHTMLQQTILRVRCPSIFAAPVLFGNIRHQESIKRQLEGIECTPSEVFLEPVMRNTAAPVFLSALYALQKGFDKALILPSDHCIQDENAFWDDIERAEKSGSLITYFGIEPDHPHDGFGYISEKQSGIIFHEKPDIQTARKLIAAGALWNSGIFLLDVVPFLQEVEIVAADLLDMLKVNSLEAYAHIADAPFDKVFCEQTRKGTLLRAGFDWHDLGSWDALRQIVEAA